MSIETTHQTVDNELLTGEDAKRLVSYIDHPTPPTGHAGYLEAADAVYASLKPVDDPQQ